MPYTPVSHTLSISPTGSAVDFDFSDFPPTTSTEFIQPTFTLQENPTGNYTPQSFLLSDFFDGGLVNSATSAFPTRRPSSGQLYPR